MYSVLVLCSIIIVCIVDQCCLYGRLKPLPLLEMSTVRMG